MMTEEKRQQLTATCKNIINSGWADHPLKEVAQVALDSLEEKPTYQVRKFFFDDDDQLTEYWDEAPKYSYDRAPESERRIVVVKS